MSTPLTPLGDDHRADHAPLEPGTAESTLAETPAPRPDDTGSTPVVLDSGTAVSRQKARFGGVKIGSAFFGWLTATGMAVLLITLLAAAGVAFGLATNTTVDQAVQESQNATSTAQTVGLAGAITLLVILFVSYYCGGYVAGRMARFNGFRQGLAVWLWGIAMALFVAALAAVAGSQYNVLARLNLPRIPVDEGQVTAVGLIAIGAAVLTSMFGALLGGLAGMHFHRRVDAAGQQPLDHSSGSRDA